MGNIIDFLPFQAIVITPNTLTVSRTKTFYYRQDAELRAQQ
jgi:hypothetical protein